MGVPNDVVVILQVSRMEAWKGHMLHLQALSKIKDMREWVCWILGGPQRPEEERYMSMLQRTAAELGIGSRVRFLGQRKDVPRLLAAADVFCQPNKGPEPFGIVFIEALWAGLPVLTTAMGGPMEIIDESCGFLVEPENPAVLADSLRKLIESPELRARLGRGGAPRAQQLCNPASQINKIERCLAALAGPHQRLTREAS
jgi:glycosyltransferase involved in cell wall biosynthesis